MPTLFPTQKKWADWLSRPALLTTVLLLQSANPAAAQRLLGIDVSAWQGNITTTNWATLKRPTDQSVGGVFGDGRDFVFIRSSRGGTTGYYDQTDSDNSNGLNTLSQRYDDPYFVQNITRATAAGMWAGSYHFSRPDIIATTPNANGIPNNGTDEANHMIEMAGAWMRPGFLLPVHDLEAGISQRTPDEQAQFSIDFSDRIFAVMGIRPIMYINGSYANDLESATVARQTQVVAGNLLWTARWPNQSDPDSIPVQTMHPNQGVTTVYGPWDDAPNPTHPWRFWQYASTARLNGYANGTANIDVDVVQGGMEFLKDHLVPALWVTNSDGPWTTLTNWNSGVAPTAPVQGPGQVARVGSLTLPATRLPGSDDTVVLDRPSANVTITLASGTHTIRKLTVRESLNITGGSLIVGYVPVADSTPLSAQFSGAVALSGGSFSVHTLQVDAAQTFTLAGGTLTFNTINLLPHASTPAKLHVTGNVIFTGLTDAPGLIANGAGAGSSGFIDLGGGTRTFDVTNVATGTDLSVDVPITNGGLTKISTGTLSLGAANTYLGGTSIQGGRVELAGSLASGVTVQSGGTLALGAATGIRTVAGSLALNAGGTLRIRVNGPTAGTEHDRLSLTGAASTVALGGTLDLIAAAGLAAGATFRIIDNTGSSAAVSGTFAGLPQDAEFYADAQWWRISYTGGTGNDVVLTRLAPTAWHAWLLTHFPADVGSGTLTGDFVDVENDGVANRLEYALSGHPKATTTAPLWQASILGGRLALTFTRVVANNDITLTVQGADAPEGPWTNLAASTTGGVTTALTGGVLVSESGAGATRSVEVRDAYLTSDPLHPRRFLRVQVTRP